MIQSKKIFILGLFFSMALSMVAQLPSFQWAKQFGGGTGVDYGYAMATDAAGNIYTTGYFNGVTDFDPGPGTYNLTPVGSYDAFIMKQDASGNLKWAVQFGSVSYDYGFGIAVDGSGNVYTTGLFADTADFDPGAGVFYMVPDAVNATFISKLDASGKFVWAKCIQSTSNTTAYGLSLDASGNIYTTGLFYGTADFDPDTGKHYLTSVSNNNLFILKLNSSGQFVWARNVESKYGSYGWTVLADAAGNVYTCGNFEGLTDFNPGAGTYNLTSTGNSIDFFILKLDASGNFVWADQIGGSLDDDGRSMALDTKGNIHLTGTFYGTVDFDPGTGVSQMMAGSKGNMFITKLDSSGKLMWVKNFGGDSAVAGASIHLDAAGNVYTTGGFKGTIDFDPGAGVKILLSAGLTDIYISKLDAAGNYVWAIRLGAKADDWASCLTLDASGNILTTGGFVQKLDFDPGTPLYELTPLGSTDIFVLKLDPKSSGLDPVGISAQIEVFPNPGKGVFNLVLPHNCVVENIKVFDATGHLIYCNNGSADMKKIDLSNFTAGLYILTLTDQQGIQTSRKIIKE